MKHQQVNVDYWAMAKALLAYGALTILCWVMVRLFNTVFTLPGRFRAQQTTIQDTLNELQRRYPDLNITEEDLKEAEKELEEWDKEEKQKEKALKENEEENTQVQEDKKTL